MSTHLAKQWYDHYKMKGHSPGAAMKMAKVQAAKGAEYKWKAVSHPITATMVSETDVESVFLSGPGPEKTTVQNAMNIIDEAKELAIDDELAPAYPHLVPDGQHQYIATFLDGPLAGKEILRSQENYLPLPQVWPVELIEENDPSKDIPKLKVNIYGISEPIENKDAATMFQHRYHLLYTEVVGKKRPNGQLLGTFVNRGVYKLTSIAVAETFKPSFTVSNKVLPKPSKHTAVSGLEKQHKFAKAYGSNEEAFKNYVIQLKEVVKNPSEPEPGSILGGVPCSVHPSYTCYWTQCNDGSSVYHYTAPEAALISCNCGECSL